MVGKAWQCVTCLQSDQMTADTLLASLSFLFIRSRTLAYGKVAHI